MQRAVASGVLLRYIFLMDMEQEGRSKVTMSDDDTKLVRELTAEFQK